MEANLCLVLVIVCFTLANLSNDGAGVREPLRDDERLCAAEAAIVPRTIGRRKLML